jgi:DNA-binding transcriptional LysR family regulator
MSFELRQLRHVLALAEHGSFSRAALALNLSQPTLSRSIQAIEREVGTPLFHRTSSGATPTDIGRLFVQRARDVLKMADELDGADLRGGVPRSGRVTIGAGILPAESLVGPATAQFAGLYPGVSIELRVTNWDDLLRELRSHELDFFVAEVSTLEGEPDLAVEPMSPHPVFFFARQGHPLVRRRRITPADLFAWPFALPSRIPPRLLDPLLATKRASPDQTVAGRAFPSSTCNSLSTVKRIVERSDAITGLTLSCIAAELEAGTWAMLAAAPWLHTHYGVVSLKGRPMTQAAEKFKEIVLETESAVTLEEQQLLRRWRRPTRGRRPRSAERGRATH